jgi:excisionase family DNA binding protein
MSGAFQRGYRIAEAAKYMGVSPWFIELKIRSGEFPALKLCRHYTVLKEDMDRFLDSQRGHFDLPAVSSAAVHPERLLLDILGAARALSTTVWTVRSLLWDGKIPFVKIGRRFLVDPADLRAYIAREKSGGAV